MVSLFSHHWSIISKQKKKLKPIIAVFTKNSWFYCWHPPSILWKRLSILGKFFTSYIFGVVYFFTRHIFWATCFFTDIFFMDIFWATYFFYRHFFYATYFFRHNILWRYWTKTEQWVFLIYTKISALDCSVQQKFWIFWRFEGFLDKSLVQNALDIHYEIV